MTGEVDPIEAALGHRFADPALLEQALTHRSWVHEHGGADNERLEFLGDAILSATATLLLVERFPDAPEGALSRLRSRLVNTDALADIGLGLGLGERLRLGRGEEATGGRGKSSLLADVTEAVLGALFLDAGFDACRRVVTGWMEPRLVADDMNVAWKDPRSRLQELVQQRWRVTPTYEVLAIHGPPHAPTFEVAVRMGERELGIGNGPSKREAAQQAAIEAYARLVEEAP